MSASGLQQRRRGAGGPDGSSLPNSSSAGPSVHSTSAPPTRPGSAGPLSASNGHISHRHRHGAGVGRRGVDEDEGEDTWIGSGAKNRNYDNNGLPGSSRGSSSSSSSAPSHRPTASLSAAATATRSGAGSITLTSPDGGHRIAYDPRDLDDEGEVRDNPRLTLMEETLLLGLKDRQGYLSFWNDNISYTLRGCILIELALRNRIALMRSAPGRGYVSQALSLQDRLVEVVDPRMTGEVLLDEALKLMKATPERMSTSTWIDLLSGETWNVTKIGYQLKQVRERLAKGLVDKGVLRTEKKNFLLFDMATHPVADAAAKEAVLRRVLTLLTGSSRSVHPLSLYREERRPIALAATRALCLVCCAFSANVLENALTHLSYDAREVAFQKADDLLGEASQWPMFPATGAAVGAGNAPPPVAQSLSGGETGGGGGGGASGATAAGAKRGSRLAGAGIGEGSVASSGDEANGAAGFAGGGGGGGGGGYGGGGGAGMGVSAYEMAKAVRADLLTHGGGGGSSGSAGGSGGGATNARLSSEAQFECIAAVLKVLSQMDSLL